DVVRAQLFSETVQIGAHSGCIAGPRFRQHRDLVSGYVLERFANMRMASIGIRSIEKPQTVIVPVQKHFGESLDSESGLVRVMSDPNRSRAHGQPAGVDPGIAK